jgi:hypothetical protein
MTVSQPVSYQHRLAPRGGAPAPARLLDPTAKGVGKSSRRPDHPARWLNVHGFDDGTHAWPGSRRCRRTSLNSRRSTVPQRQPQASMAFTSRPSRRLHGRRRRIVHARRDTRPAQTPQTAPQLTSGVQGSDATAADRLDAMRPAGRRLRSPGRERPSRDAPDRASGGGIETSFDSPGASMTAGAHWHTPWSPHVA